VCFVSGAGGTRFRLLVWQSERLVAAILGSTEPSFPAFFIVFVILNCSRLAVKKEHQRTEFVFLRTTIHYTAPKNSFSPPRTDFEKFKSGGISVRSMRICFSLVCPLPQYS
jgi:hypothetical protein